MNETKVCNKCHKCLPMENFCKSRTKSGYGANCKECRSIEWSRNPGRPRTGPKPYVEPLEKNCGGCKRTLPIDSFAVRTERKNGRRPRCKECTSRAHSEWREKNPLSSRLRNLKSKYDMNGDDYYRLLASQNNGCAICGSAESGWSTSPFLHVDHDHDTGIVRGLLCHSCNIALGCLEKTKAPLTAFSEYINRFRQEPLDDWAVQGMVLVSET